MDDERWRNINLLKQQQRMSNSTSSSTTRNMKNQGCMYDQYYNVNKGTSSSSSWDIGLGFEGGELGFSWPPRSYTCSFCKREFRSAQALGGHMNVHRRDRARLRHHSPPTATDHLISNNNNANGGTHFSLLNLNLEPNPNFNSNPTSSPSFLTKFPQFNSTLPPLNCPPVQNCSSKPMTSDLMMMMTMKNKASSLKGQFGDNDKVFKKGEFVRLDLEIGLVTHHHPHHLQSNYKDELDLELRLGYI